MSNERRPTIHHGAPRFALVPWCSKLVCPKYTHVPAGLAVRGKCAELDGENPGEICVPEVQARLAEGLEVVNTGTEALRAATVRIAELTERRDALLALVARLSQETPLADEVKDWTAQRAALIAEVGTLRAKVAELERDARNLVAVIDRDGGQAQANEDLGASIARAVLAEPKALPLLGTEPGTLRNLLDAVCDTVFESDITPERALRDMGYGREEEIVDWHHMRDRLKARFP